MCVHKYCLCGSQASYMSFTRSKLIDQSYSVSIFLSPVSLDIASFLLCPMPPNVKTPCISLLLCLLSEVWLLKITSIYVILWGTRGATSHRELWNFSVSNSISHCCTQRIARNLLCHSLDFTIGFRYIVPLLLLKILF